MKSLLLILFSLTLIFLAEFFLTNEVLAVCDFCGTAVCPDGTSTPLRCCTNNPYPDACSGQPRTCTDQCPYPVGGSECTTAADCPNGNVFQQCGQSACNVAKACSNGFCIYTCYGLPPCGPGGATDTPTPIGSPPTPTPTPTLYPTSAVSGNLYQQTVSNVCSGYSGSNPTINLIPQSYSSGVTSSCTPNVPGGTYQCTISYNNQTYPGIPLSQGFTLSTSATGYGSGQWEVGNTCAGATNNTRTIASGGNNTGWGMFYLTSPWMKAKDISLNTNGLGYSLPAAVLPLDSDDSSQRYIIIAQSGSSAGLAGNLTTFNSLNQPVSQNNWQATNYQAKSMFTKDTFFSYVKGRKQYQTLTSLDSSLSQITASGIYYYNAGGSPVSIASTPNFNFVLIVDGNVTITGSGGSFNRNSGTDTPQNSVAILANTLSFDPSLSYAYGIFFASSGGTGSSTSSLKIKGNLVIPSFINQREPSNNAYPAVFTVLYIPTYLNLLPYLSVAKYDQTIQ